MIEPPVLDRETAPPPAPAIERRRFTRRSEDRSELVRTVLSTLFAVCGGLAVVFLFFAAMGRVDLGDAIAATVVAIVLGAIWFAGFYQRMRTRSELITRRDRERRGF